jgi:phosphate transport system substrate-binding protein
MTVRFNMPARCNAGGQPSAVACEGTRRARNKVVLAMFAGLVAAGTCGAQTKVTIGGAGSMVPVMQELARGFEAKHGAQGLEVMSNSLGSGGGIKGAEAGRLAIGLTGRALKDNEKGAVVYRQLAVMPVVVAANADLQVSGLTSAQLCGIYSGSMKSWKQLGGPDLAIVPLTRNEDDSDKEALRDHIGCYKGLKESSDVVVLSSGSGMNSSLASRPAAIGLTTYEAVLKSNGRIKALAIDGVQPGPDTVAAGKYRLVKDFAVVTRGEPQGVTRNFIDFAAGADGNKIMATAGLVPRR